MRNKKIIFYLLPFIICFFGCKEEEGFAYQLEEEKLVEIITDLHLSEAATQHLSLNYRDSMSKVYLIQVLEIHEVPKEIFKPEYVALKRDPQKLVIIYDKVIKRLNELKLNRKKDSKAKGQEAKKRTKKK